jgi:hypothetical protein
MKWILWLAYSLTVAIGISLASDWMLMHGMPRFCLSLGGIVLGGMLGGRVWASILIGDGEKR